MSGAFHRVILAHAGIHLFLVILAKAGIHPLPAFVSTLQKQLVNRVVSFFHVRVTQGG